MSLKLLTMSEDEKKKYETIQKEKAAHYAKQKEAQAEKKRIMELSQQNRKVKQDEVHTEAAKGHKLTYGANITKFEPPKNQGGWGWASNIDTKTVGWGNSSYFTIYELRIEYLYFLAILNHHPHN